MPCTSQPSQFKIHKYVRWCLYACSSALCNFHHSPPISSNLDPNVLLKTLFSNTLNLCFSLKVTEQVSQPYNTTSNIIIIRVFFPEVLHYKRRNQGCYSAEGRSSTANSTKADILKGTNRCGSFPLLSAPHSLFSIWTDFKRSEKFPGTPKWRGREWIWLTGLSGLHRNSPQG